MLEFIIGTNEQARRNVLYSSIKDWGKPAFLIVPEQFSFESEKLLGEALGAKAAQNIEVTSFSRLCNSIFRRFGGVAGEYSDDTTKLLLMGAALHECKDELRFYKKSSENASFTQELVRTDSEIKNAGLCFSDLLELSEKASDPILKDKAADLALIFSLYDAMLSKSFLDPLTDIARACAVLSENDFFSDTAVFIDNFTGFTGSEYKLLREILCQSPLVSASLCCPDIYDRTGGNGLFSKTQRTAARLERAAKSAGVSVRPPKIAVLKDDSRPEAIAAVEKQFLQTCLYTPKNGGEVEIVAAADPCDEAEFVACKVRSLAKQGMRWREIAVIARDFSPYKTVLPEAFRKAGVPLYSDKPASLATHPLAAFIAASLSACRGNFEAADIIRIIKTGLIPVSAEDAAEFENYCFIWNIRGKMFLSDFTGSPKGFDSGKPENLAPLERINALRKAVCEPLARLRIRISDANGKEFSSALYDYLCECNVKEGLFRLYDEYSAAGNISAADDLDTFWSFLISALDKFSAALSDARLGGAALGRLFELVMMSAKIGVLPKTIDCVAAGTADRMRPSGIKAVFVIGALDGRFPATPKDGGLFTRTERKKMSSLGIELGEGENDELLSERMYAYTAFTCASEQIYLTYPKYDFTGTEQQPSVLISRLEQAAAAKTVSTDAFPEEFWLCSEELAFERLSRFGKSVSPAAEALHRYFESRPLWKERAKKLGETICPESFCIEDASVSEQIFGERLRLSPSRIEKFESCPFSYFLSYGLYLKKPLKAELSPIYAGNLIHYVLQQVVSAHGGAGIAGLSDKRLRDEISAALNGYLDDVFGTAKDKSARFMYMFDRIAGFMFRLLRRIGEEFSVSEFEPYAFELPVEDGGEVSAYRLSTADGHTVLVQGKIDRVDVLNKNGSRYVRVVDYKTGAKQFSLNDVFYGINIQMLVYLFSVWKGGHGGLEKSLPAGVLYMPARDSVVSGERNMSAEKAEKSINEPLRANGLLLDDPMVLSAMEPGFKGVFIPVKQTKEGCAASGGGTLATLEQMGKIKGHIDCLLLSMAEELYGGKIPALPHRQGEVLSCDRCDFACVCRRGSEAPVRLIKKMSTEDFYKLAEEENEHGDP